MNKLFIIALSLFISVTIMTHLSAQNQTNIRPSTTSSPFGVTVSSCSIIIGTTNVPQELVPSNLSRSFLAFQVQQQGSSPIPTIGYSFTTAIPSLGTEDTFTLAPLATVSFENQTIIQNAIWVVGPSGTVVTCSQG